MRFSWFLFSTLWVCTLKSLNFPTYTFYLAWVWLPPPRTLMLFRMVRCDVLKQVSFHKWLFKLSLKPGLASRESYSCKCSNGTFHREGEKKGQCSLRSARETVERPLNWREDVLQRRWSSVHWTGAVTACSLCQHCAFNEDKFWWFGREWPP